MSSAPQINQWNEQWRSSPMYGQLLQQAGVDPTHPFKLNDNQRHLIQRALESQGVDFHGNEIDSAGNMNEKEGFGHYLKKYGLPALGVGAALFGVPFLTPGLLGGIGTGAGSLAGAVAPSVNGITTALPGAIASQGVSAGLGTGAGMAGGLSGFLGGLGKKFGGDLAQRAIGGIGSGLAGAAQAGASNRGVALDAAQQAEMLRQRQQEAYQNQLLQRAQEDRASLTDAFTKSVQANRVANRTGYQPASLNLIPGAAASTLPSFNTGFAAPTAQEKGDAQALYDQIHNRLYTGSTLPPLEKPTLYQNDPNLMKPGAGERIGSWLGPALTFAGSFRNPSTQGQR